MTDSRIIAQHRLHLHSPVMIEERLLQEIDILTGYSILAIYNLTFGNALHQSATHLSIQDGSLQIAGIAKRRVHETQTPKGFHRRIHRHVIACTGSQQGILPTLIERKHAVGKLTGLSKSKIYAVAGIEHLYLILLRIIDDIFPLPVTHLFVLLEQSIEVLVVSPFLTRILHRHAIIVDTCHHRHQWILNQKGTIANQLYSPEIEYRQRIGNRNGRKLAFLHLHQEKSQTEKDIKPGCTASNQPEQNGYQKHICPRNPCSPSPGSKIHEPC